MEQMKKKKKRILIGALVAMFSFPVADACTRVVYQGPNQTILTARSMDWQTDIGTNLWIMPKGIERTGEVGPNSLKWKSIYGSVIATAYDMSCSDGMNEKGLVANILWLTESEYPKWDQQKPGLSIALWAQYVLDNFATVAEAVAALEQDHFTVITDKMPGTDRNGNVHLSLSDTEGDNAIIEYVKGELKIYHDKSYLVMTNSPTFDQQLAIQEYWKGIGGLHMLPGTNRAADRFVRASYYMDVVPKVEDIRVATATAFSVIRNASVPLGITTPDQPNISSTRWRTVSDHKNKIYYFESALSPHVFWVDLNEIDLSKKGQIKKLNLINGEIYSGNASMLFKETPPFRFQGL